MTPENNILIVTPRMEELASLCRSNSLIEAGLYREYDVKRGLRDVNGKGVLAEQAYRTASNSVFEYLQKENIDYLGDVIPSEEQGDFDFENGKEFEFVFEIGEAPEIKLELSDKDKLTYSKIKVDKKMHDDYRANYLRQYGRLVDADEVTSDEALSVTLDNGEMNVADAYVGLISMSEEERKPFIGKKVGDMVEFGGLLGAAPIMPIKTGSPAKFIGRGGRIPAPIQSLKN